jgi:hypothetical protein
MKEHTAQPLAQLLFISSFTFPNHYRLPPYLPQFFLIRSIPPEVLLEFSPPEFESGLRSGSFRTTLMAMPKTTVDIDDSFEPRQDDVRGSRKILPMKPESQFQTMQYSTDHNFGLGVLPADRTHDLTAYEVDGLR